MPLQFGSAGKGRDFPPAVCPVGGGLPNEDAAERFSLGGI
jgi:hypothetical protein